MIDAEDKVIAQAKCGDKTALTTLVNRYSGKIYAIAYKLMRNREDAEDIMQDSFIKFIKNIQSFEGRSTLYSWLYKITVNTAVEKLRRKNPEQFQIDFDTVDYNNHGTHPVLEIPYYDKKDLDNPDITEKLNSAIKNLNPKLRTVFILRDIEKLSIKETAGILNLSESNVKVRLMRARMQLKEKLIRLHIGES